MEHEAEHNRPLDQRDAELEVRLYRERPVPRPEFRGALRRKLERAPRRGGVADAAGWRPLAGAYLGLGTLLLAVALVGVAGLGPFAA
jgi:hypothetical protein